MKPVVLTHLPNEPRFVGTFDTASFKNWWLSNPLPGRVASIIDVDWAYGQYHVALCLMENGTYSIYRSNDYGINWQEVWNTSSRLYKVIQLDPGWLVCSASDGWYASYNSGLSWRRISDLAPGCKEAVNLGDDTVIAHDGRDVWKSTDGCVTWRKVFDHRGTRINVVHGRYYTYKLDCDSYPALDGHGDQVLIGSGKMLFISDDRGETWNEMYNIDYKLNCGSRSLRRILQIVNTKISPDIEHNRYVIRVILKDSRTGYPKYIRYIYNKYDVYGEDYEGEKSRYVILFDAPYSASPGIVAYDVLRPGSDQFERMVVSSEIKFDSLLGKYIPMIRYSLDGGETWTAPKIKNATVYPNDPTQEVSTWRGMVVIDDYTDMVWIGCPCHNRGRWNAVRRCYTRGISGDMDLQLRKEVIKYLPYGNIMTVKGIRHTSTRLRYMLRKTFNVQRMFDVLTQTAFNTTHNMDTLTEIRDVGYYYTMGMPLMAILDEEIDSDIVVEKEFNIPGESNVVVKAIFDKTYNCITRCKAVVDNGIYSDMIAVTRKYHDYITNVQNRRAFLAMYDVLLPVRGESHSSSMMSIVLTKSRFDEILVDAEKYMPQIYDIRAKMLNYDVYDSRKDDEV